MSLEMKTGLCEVGAAAQRAKVVILTSTMRFTEIQIHHVTTNVLRQPTTGTMDPAARRADTVVSAVRNACRSANTVETARMLLPGIEMIAMIAEDGIEKPRTGDATAAVTAVIRIVIAEKKARRVIAIAETTIDTTTGTATETTEIDRTTATTGPTTGAPILASVTAATITPDLLLRIEVARTIITTTNKDRAANAIAALLLLPPRPPRIAHSPSGTQHIRILKTRSLASPSPSSAMASWSTRIVSMSLAVVSRIRVAIPLR